MAHRRPHFLVDTSALNRVRVQTVADRLVPLFDQGRAHSCAMIDLEVLYSARSFGDYEETSRELSGLPEVPLTPLVFERARAVQRELARTGHHRVAVPDLVVAAAAELAGDTVLHYDAHFERIARVTGQPHQWVARRGSI